MAIRSNNKDAILRKMRAKVAAGLAEAAKTAAGLHHEDLSVMYPPASEEGEFPAERTGRLKSAVAWNLDIDELRSRMGYTPGVADYWKPLMDMGRLGPVATVIREKDTIRAAFKRGVDSVS